MLQTSRWIILWQKGKVVNYVCELIAFKQSFLKLHVEVSLSIKWQVRTQKYNIELD